MYSKMAEASILCSQDQLSCAICLEKLTDQATIPCGHSYCRSCITACWDYDDHKRIYSCPQCRQTFTPRPVLGKNIMLTKPQETNWHTAQHYISYGFMVDEHNNHDTVSAAAERTEKQYLEDAVVFTPDYTDRDRKGTNTHSFFSPYAGQFQCSLTDLVFVMEDRGKMVYKIMPWDSRLLDGLGQMQPAGPLYSIECFEGSISQLHLPHCEILSEENKDSLTVAHFTEGNVELLQPLKVTETHVIIGIKELSLFGLIKKKIFPDSPVRAQVLLFLRPISVRQREKILDVHLLPETVPVSEVQSQHKENMYLKTTSTCHLIPGIDYSLRCEPEAFEVQPQGQMFDCNFGPNYHPTFEVFLDVDTDEFKMGVWDRIEEKEVWTTRRIILTASSPNTDISDLRTITEFVDNHREVLIARVISVMPIADGLRDKHMISPETYSEIDDARPRQRKMRILFDVLDSGGPAVKAEFYTILKDKESFLVRDLESEY